MITRPLRRLMAMQGLAGVAIGVCAAAGVPLTGSTATGVDFAVLAPTAAIQIRPAIRHASLPLTWYLPLTILASALALTSWALWSTIGIALGVISWFSVAEPAIRAEVVSYLGLAMPLLAGGSAVWKATR